jgi:hypothetical protein
MWLFWSLSVTDFGDVKTLLNFYTRYSEADAFADKKRGYTDAVKHAATANENHLENGITYLRQTGVAHSEFLKQEIGVKQDKWQEQAKPLEIFVTQTYPEKRQSITEKYRSELSNLERTIGPNSSEFKETARDLQETQAQYARIFDEVHERPLRVRGENFYLPVLAFLAIGEIPLNQLAFSFLFESAPFLGYLVAAAVGLFLVFLAHLIGVQIRQKPVRENKTQLNIRLASVIFLSCVCLLFIYVIAELRDAYVQLVLQPEASATITATGQAQNTIDISRLLSEMLDFQIGPAGMLIAILNLGVVLAGIVLSVWRHDPHPDYEKTAKRLKTLRDKHSKMESEFESEAAILREAMARRTHSLDVEFQTKRQELETMENRIKNMQSFSKLFVTEIETVVERRIASYRQGYLEGIHERPQLQGQTL